MVLRRLCLDDDEDEPSIAGGNPVMELDTTPLISCWRERVNAVRSVALRRAGSVLSSESWNGKP